MAKQGLPCIEREEEEKGTGDCRSAETRFQGIATCTMKLPTIRRSPEVGVPRPVFRGLRPWISRGMVPSILSRRSAETRFQGIATEATVKKVRHHFRGRSAETRFQGIATRSPSPPPWTGVGGVGVPRPVFRGLRHEPCPRAPGAAWSSECRDPFSGDCDMLSSLPPPQCCLFLVGVPRPVFRGLRQVKVDFHIGWRQISRSAETRFQGIATPEAWGGTTRARVSECRDPFSGDCDAWITANSP